jgi:hypothetical protein
LLVFCLYFGLSYVGSTLLAGGLGHVVGFPAFRALVRGHGIVPPGWALPAAAAVTVFELAAGGSAAGLLLVGPPTAFAAPVFASCAVASVAFWLYVRRLLGQPVRAASCGCSPASGPLTPASLTPSAALALVSLAGLAAAVLGPATLAPLVPALLSALWGVTLAGLLVVFPAAVPAAAGG